MTVDTQGTSVQMSGVRGGSGGDGRDHKGTGARNGGYGDVVDGAGDAVVEAGDDAEAVGAVTSQNWKVPDGGYGWVIVVSAMVVSIIVDGLSYTFGLFLGEFERAFDQPKSTIALASSLQVGIYLFIGPVVSAVTNRFGCRRSIIFGSFLAGVAFIASAWSNNVTVLILTYGVLGGIGFGFMYLPSIVAVSIYFEERRAVATGIAVCGSGVGTFILAPMTDYLLYEYDWRWTLLLLGGLTLNGMVFGALVRPLELRRVDGFTDVAEDEDAGEMVKVNGQPKTHVVDSIEGVDSSGRGHDRKEYLPSSEARNKEEIPLLTITDEEEKLTIMIPETSRTQSKEESRGMEYSSTPAMKFNSTSQLSKDIAVNISIFQLIVDFLTRLRSVVYHCFLSDRLTYLESHRRGENRYQFSRKATFLTRVFGVTEKAVESLDQGKHTGSNKKIPSFPNSPEMTTRRRTLSTSDKETLGSSPRTRAHVPVGLSLISLSDANLNQIREDVHLPLSRRDIHLSGPLAFPDSDARSRSEQGMGLYVQSIQSIASLAAVDVKEIVQEQPRGLWSCLPKSARETMEEMLNLSILKERSYWCVLLGNFFCMLGFYVPFVYMPDRAQELGIPEDQAAFLISIIGITNTIGRVMTGVLINFLNLDCAAVTSGALLIAGIVTAICPFCHTYPSLAAVSAIFGVCVAAYISLCSVLLCELLGVESLTNAFGFVILFRGVACIMGPPIAGAIIDNTGLFDPSFYVAGTMIVLGAVCHAVLLTPFVRRRKF